MLGRSRQVVLGSSTKQPDVLIFKIVQQTLGRKLVCLKMLRDESSLVTISTKLSEGLIRESLPP